MALRVLLAIRGDDLAAWRDAFVAQLPDATFFSPENAPAEVDFVMAWRPPEHAFARTRVMRAIFNLGAGVDALLASPSLPREVPIYRLEDAGMAIQMAEYVLYAVLRAYREFDAYAAAQRESLWRRRPRIAKEAFGVGFLGVGVLGQAVARALAPLGFPLLGYARTPRQVRGVRMFIGAAMLGPFLRESRVLVCLLPSTSETRNLLSRELLAQLPRGAHVVNIARGEILCDDDLLALLDEGHLGGATLDVFAEEPLPRDHRFWHHPGITLTPHVAAVTLVPESVEQVAAKLRSIERGVEPAGRVDRRRGY